MMKKWTAEKKFVLDCPICREPALPQQHDEGGYRMIHPGRVATCRVKEQSDGAEIVRTHLDKCFGTNDTTIANQARTGPLSANDSPAERGKAHFVSVRYEGKTFVDHELDRWETEGGTFASERGCTYKD